LLGAVGSVLTLAIVGLAVALWSQRAEPGAGGGAPALSSPPAKIDAPRHPEAQPTMSSSTATGGTAHELAKSGSEALVTNVTPGTPARLTRPVDASTPWIQVLVPAYFYPGGPDLKSWQRLMDAASRIKLVAIANPGSGPGDQRIYDYQQIIQVANERGVRVIGYISTQYGKRPATDVEKDIDHWVEFYPQVAGFFLDQQSTSAKDVSYYLRARDYARTKVKNAFIITNPGVLCDEEYFAQSVSNVTCIFANFEGFDQLNLSMPLKQYSPSRFAALAYQIKDVKAMRQVISDALVKRIGFLYISDSSKGDNPWAQLPSYWEEEVNAVSRVN
jgi:hypothetical protein